MSAALGGWTLGFVALYMGALWLGSLAKRDVSIVDIAWGPGFGGIAVIALVWGDPTPRGFLLAALTCLWGLRLGAYLLWRSWGEAEDPRYRAMRQHHGERFGRVSLVTVFGLQGALMWIISLPVQVASGSAEPLGARDALGSLIWAVGMLFETVGDAQLARFKSDPGNAGRVLDTGLWRYTRHPNYFGDFLVWWGIWIVSAVDPGRGWTLISPILMSFLLLRVSGVPLLERSLRENRPAYADYAARTSAFFPWPPRPKAPPGRDRS